MNNLEYICDKFIEYIFALDIGIEVEQSSVNGSITLHFYDTRGRKVGKVVRIWVDTLDIFNENAPILYKVVYIGDSSTILSDYSKKGLTELKNYYDLLVKVVNRLNSEAIPCFCYRDGSLLKCLRRSYAKYGKRLKVIEV